MNRIETVHLDGFAIAFTLCAILFAAVFSGAVSSFGTNRTHLLAALQESSRSHGGGGTRATLRRGLLVAEVTLTVVLLVGAGLLLKSYQRLRTTDIGVPIDNVLTLSVSLPEARYGDSEKPALFFEQWIARVRALPGVKAAALVSRAPGQGWGGDGLLTVVEHPPLPKGVGLDLQRRACDPGYFHAMQIPLLEGRTFHDGERLARAKVAILSESGVKLLFPNHEDPIGKHIRRNDDIYEVIGVVGDTRWTITQPVMPMWYMPIFGNGYNYATVVVRATRNVESLAVPVQKLIGELDPDLPVFGVRTLRESVGRSTASSQFDSLLVLAFAVIALFLAAAGLYSVVAYLVTQRTSEIGVRIALGARRSQVIRLVLADGLRPALGGLFAGLVASAFAVRLIRSMLYETQPLDVTVYASVTLTLVAIAALACLVPAWRASRLDPMQALRTE
jgi:putative ABC transport system permease protein